MLRATERLRRRGASPRGASAPSLRDCIHAGARLERFFRLTAVTDLINGRANDDPHRLFRLCARRIAATYAMRLRKRSAAIRFLAAKTIEVS